MYHDHIGNHILHQERIRELEKQAKFRQMRNTNRINPRVRTIMTFIGQGLVRIGTFMQNIADIQLDTRHMEKTKRNKHA